MLTISFIRCYLLDFSLKPTFDQNRDFKYSSEIPFAILFQQRLTFSIMNNIPCESTQKSKCAGISGVYLAGAALQKRFFLRFMTSEGASST